MHLCAYLLLYCTLVAAALTVHVKQANTGGARDFEAQRRLRLKHEQQSTGAALQQVLAV